MKKDQTLIKHKEKIFFQKVVPTSKILVHGWGRPKDVALLAKFSFFKMTVTLQMQRVPVVEKKFKNFFAFHERFFFHEKYG